MNRWRPLTWILLSVACFVAAFYFWRLGDQWREEKIKSTPDIHLPARGSVRSATVTVTHASTAPVLPKPFGPQPSMTNAVATGTNASRFAFRLSNTPRTIGQLARDQHAILLENALIDSSKPVDLAIPDELRAHGDPGSYIVQSRGALNDAFRAALKAAGADIVSYIPNNAYLVTASPSAAAQLRSLPQAQSVLPYEPYYKLKSPLLDAVMQGKGTPDTLNVAVFPGQNDSTIAALDKLGVKVVSQSASPFGTEITVRNASDAPAIARLPGVQIVEPFHPRGLANDMTRVLTGEATDTVTSSNYMGLTGSNVLVGVSDTWWPTNGAPVYNPDLMNIFSPFDNGGAGGVNDFEGHATHVGGIIAGSGSNSPINAVGSVAGANFRGKAPLANLWALPINYPPLSDEQLQEATASTNAPISNNSWGYVGSSGYDLGAASYDQAVRDSLPNVPGSQPVLYVFAAGNNGGGVDDGTGGTADTVLSPGSAKNIITVGASELPRNITNDVTTCDSCGGGCSTNQPWQAMTDSKDQVASFSSRGNVGIGIEGEFGRYKPDVIAPGTMVVSTRSMTWDTNAYYNPSSGFSFSFIGDQVPPGQLFNYSVFIPCNAVQLGIAATSTSPKNENLLIYVQPNNFPTTSAYYVLGTNSVSLPPDAALTPTDTTWFYSVASTNTSATVSYDITTSVVTTNDFGDYFDVLRTNLNDQLISSNSSVNGGLLYRYESGTSMAAPAVSGTLALIEDYFTNKLSLSPSPALLKAMIINGARSINPIYDFQVQSTINYQGWGIVNLTNSLPMGLASSFGQAAPMLYLDQDPTNALATGDSRTFTVTVDPSAQNQPLRITLVWTDPPGNPAASIKLVNNLDLVVTNVDSVSSPDGAMIYFGNDIAAGNTFNLPWDTNAAPVPNADVVNNVENVYIAPPLGSNYTITVAARNVNVNAVTANTNGVVQDFALVVSSGNGTISNALTLANAPVVSDSTPNVTFVADMFTNSTTVSGGILLNQHVGASSPLQGTNTLSLDGTVLQSDWGTNGQITLGVTNQWHFYVVTNTGASSDFTNAVFATFLPPNLSLTPGSANASALTNATRYEADIDLYVSQNSALTNLDPTAVATADKSLLRGGTEFIIYSNSSPGTVYYIGVKSEDQQAAEYGFLGLFSNEPFGTRGPNGELNIRGINVPQAIPDGSPTRPGISYTFAIAPEPMNVRRVVVTNTLSHENFGDLFGVLSHNRKTSMLNNHTFGNGNYTQTFIYEDNDEGDIVGSQHTDPPGTLKNFVGEQGIGLWILWEVDNALNHTGQVDNVQIRLDPQADSTGNSITATVKGLSWFYDFIDVPPEATNMTINVNIQSGPGPVELYLRYGDFPDQTTYDYKKVISAPGGSLTVSRSDLPPLKPGRYYFGIYNPITTDQTVVISWLFGLDVAGVSPNLFTTTNAPTQILDDAITTSSIYVSATQQIASINVGVVLDHPRVSDLALTLISPTGQRIMLFEDRGGVNTTNLGHLTVVTNFFPPAVPLTGGPTAATNVLSGVPNTGTLIIDYDFLTAPDSMDVYYDGVDIFSTTTINPPSGLISGPGTFTIDYGPGTSTNIYIVMNQNGNPDSQTQWHYTPRVVTYDKTYLTFTDSTNLTDMPIKYAIPPYDLPGSGTNFGGDFELDTNGEYFAPTNIFDLAGGWSMTTNQILISTNAYTNVVSVVTDPVTAHDGSNYLALGLGRISRTVSTTPGTKYTVSFAYRGPGISGWYRGEGNATDSADPESFGNNGSLIGRFQFPAGEVGQAFQLEDAGQQFRFAGTNTYVQIKQSATLDVGTNGGFTVEGWINPSNIVTQMPVVEWLARVPTNDVLGSNIVIEAGPFLYPATGHYYYLLGSTNWTVSEGWAQSLGGHLATVRTANEENWIYDNFSLFRGQNRALWIGLTNDPNNFTNFAWSSGETNILYSNWAVGQPTNCPNNNYTLILNPTNTQAGLWATVDNDGIFTCPVPNVTNFVYGVAEVPEIQTNGVQLWISVTNVPGTTNVLTPERGRLFANIVDTNNVSHVIYSAPGLVTNNVYQHVALTYSTNTGIAALYLNGTNVAITNLGVFVPKTGGDVLLGKDMSRSITNNYFSGKLDEISIYNRFLSPTEIAAIYNISALTTNRLQGKFDPSVSPAQGLAKAQVTLSTRTNILLGVNNTWQMNGFTFTATTNSMPFEITGLEPGMLIDSFGVSQAPAGNLYYFPEESLQALVGSYANGTGVPGDIGTWTLEIRDSRAGDGGTNAQLISWQLQMVLITNTATAVPANPQTLTTNLIPPGQIGYFTVDVPAWAHFATNILLFSTNPISGNAQPVDLIFNQTNPPTGSLPGDFFLINNQSAPPAIIGNPVLAATNAPGGPSTPPLVPGTRYYLGIRNNGTESALAGIEIDYDITALSNNVPVTSFLNTNDTAQYFSYDVSTNAWVSTFQLLRISGGNVDLVVRKGTPLPTVYSTDYGSFNETNADENIYVLTNSLPVPLSAGRWYIGVIKRDANAVKFTVLAKEASYADTHGNIIDLTNRVPVNFTAGPGAALTNYFRFIVTNSPGFSLTNPPAGMHFELYNLTGNGDLTVQTNDVPVAPPFFQSSQRPSRVSELIYIQTNSVLTNLATLDWYLGVPNRETNTISYTIVAVIDTNGFAAFPGAYGAGSTTVGARMGTNVYHVTNLNDDGSPGSLRYGLDNATNATTFVFDLSGTITLASSLVITNSFLTIAGQTAPGDGIAIQGNAVIQDAHDEILRYLRFRSAGGLTTNALDIDGSFENPPGRIGGVYSAGQTFGGWTVVSGDVNDVLAAGWQPADGTTSLDMNGNSGPGTITRNVPTVLGQTYNLRFAYAGNPSGGPNPKTMQVSWGGNLLGTVSFDTTGYSTTNMGWVYTNFTVIGSGNDALQFASTVGSQFGPTLDAVSLTTTTTNAPALQFANAFNVIADHVSVSWSSGDNVSVLNSTNVTVQWSMIANSLFNTDTNAGGSQLRFGDGALSLHHNLYANNYSANPRLGDNLSLDFVNNVIFDWGFFAGFSADDTADNPAGFTNRLNYSCNYLIATTNSVFTNAAFWGGTTNTWIFQTNNLLDTNLNFLVDGVNYRWGMFTNQYTQFSHPFDLPIVPPDEAFIAYERVLDFAGAAMEKRDGFDQHAVRDVRTQTGAILAARPPLPPLNSDPQPVDTDQDGLPDYWEQVVGLSPTNALDSFGVNPSDGYTYLEDYLNWLAAPHAQTTTNTPVNVDLYKMFGKTGNLLFGVTNPVNGTVYLTNNVLVTNGITVLSNLVAVFTPTNDFGGGTNYGFGAFDVMVTNADTVAYFGPVTVSVLVSAQSISYLAGSLSNAVPQTNNVSANSIQWYQVNVPTNADWATNLLLFASGPVNLWFSTNYFPSITNTADTNLLAGLTNGAATIGTGTIPPLVPGGTYYLGVQNTNNFTVNYGVEVDFHFISAPNTNTTIITLLGGSGDLRGLGIKYLNSALYIVGDDSIAGGLLGAYGTPLATNAVPTWQTNWPSANVQDHLYGVTANTNGVYAAGPNYTLTTDTAGGKEAKGLTVKYPLGGPIGAGTGGDIWNQQTPAAPGAFSYGGSEFLNAVTLATENGTNFVYATGQGQDNGNGGRLFVSKLAEDSTVLWTATDSLGSFGEPFSQGNAIVALNGYVYVAGDTNGSPYLRKYDPSGNLVWSRTTTTNGAYFGICTYANFIFAVGGTGTGVNEDFLVDKWDETGTLFWSRSYDHGANQDFFNGAVIGNGHLFAVGATYGATAGGADAAVLEISPAGGDVISTNLIGGALDDIAHGVDTDNTNLFIIGESKSYSASNDLMLVQYPLTLPIPTNAISSFTATVVTNGIQLQWTAPTNYQFSVQWSTNLVSPIIWNTFTNIITSSNGTYTFTDDGSQSGGFGAMKFYRLVQYPYP